MIDFINERKIFELLDNPNSIDSYHVKEIIEKAKECNGLSLDETAVLLKLSNTDLIEELFQAAKIVKSKIYGARVVLFAPLYTSNKCTNNCLYCGFRKDNKALHRKSLSTEEVITEAKVIESQGHKRILLICGEDPKVSDINHITSAMNAIYQNTDIRRINVETAPMSVDHYKLLKDSGVGTYVLFQETYHRETYKKMHPSGIKADYDWRITAMDRAFNGGIDDVGVGALLGLYNYKFEVLALLAHVNYLKDRFGVGPHTISVPRLNPAEGWGLSEIPHGITNQDFKKIVAIYRLSVPYTGIILSTRESASLRDELLNLGVSQISAGSKASPGGYTSIVDDRQIDQFEINDNRNIMDVLSSICDNGYIPSFCTACYRKERTGENFMQFAETCKINEFCQPNAILTFKEFLIDYGTPLLQKQGEKIISNAISDIKDSNMRKIVLQKLKEIENGKRDIYF